MIKMVVFLTLLWCAAYALTIIAKLIDYLTIPNVT